MLYDFHLSFSFKKALLTTWDTCAKTATFVIITAELLYIYYPLYEVGASDTLSRTRADNVYGISVLSTQTALIVFRCCNDTTEFRHTHQKYTQVVSVGIGYTLGYARGHL